MSDQKKRKYDATVARIVGNLLSGAPLGENPFDGISESMLVSAAVKRARAIVAEVERTEPESPS